MTTEKVIQHHSRQYLPEPEEQREWNGPSWTQRASRGCVSLGIDARCKLDLNTFFPYRERHGVHRLYDDCIDYEKRNILASFQRS